MDNNFTTKWGLQDNHVTHGITSVLIVQLLVTFVVFCILSPRFLHARQSSMQRSNLSVLRTALLSVLIVALTLFYPMLCRS